MSSVYWNILSAVQTSVATVVPNTVLRKRLQKLESDALPMCIVAPGDGGEKVAGQQFGGGVWYAYPVLVAYIDAADRLVSTGLQSWLNTRESIRNQLYQANPVLSGVSVAFDLEIEPEAAVQFGAWMGSNYEVTGWLLRYKSEEKRLS